MWLGIFVGGIFTTLLLLYRVRGAIIIGILLVSIISWPRTTPVTLFPHTAVGDSNFDFFKKVVTFHKLEKIGNALDYNYGKGQVWIALITFLYVDLFDTTGLMIKNVIDINWHYVGDAVPAFLTLIIIPFTYNIAYGLITGIFTYILLNTLPWAIRRLTGRRISPPGYEDEREPWALPEDGLIPRWMRKLARGDRRFWADDDDSYADDHSVRSRKTIDEGVDSTRKASEEVEKDRV
ncbi:hypothetical protein RSAG8_02261, partial [Rhizoctonia solani AG-8 WAC10335]